MKIIYDDNQEVYLVVLNDSEMVTYINTKDIVVAREEFINRMTRFFNDAICNKLKDV